MLKAKGDGFIERHRAIETEQVLVLGSMGSTLKADPKVFFLFQGIQIVGATDRGNRTIARRGDDLTDLFDSAIADRIDSWGLGRHEFIGFDESLFQIDPIFERFVVGKLTDRNEGTGTIKFFLLVGLGIFKDATREFVFAFELDETEIMEVLDIR